MDRNLSKGFIAQNDTEEKAKSRFDNIRKEKTKDPMVKITATITKSDWDYIQDQVLKLSNERGKVQNTSQTLREIIRDHKQV